MGKKKFEKQKVYWRKKPGGKKKLIEKKNLYVK